MSFKKIAAVAFVLILTVTAFASLTNAETETEEINENTNSYDFVYNGLGYVQIDNNKVYFAGFEDMPTKKLVIPETVYNEKTGHEYYVVGIYIEPLTDVNKTTTEIIIGKHVGNIGFDIIGDGRPGQGFQGFVAVKDITFKHTYNGYNPCNLEEYCLAFDNDIAANVIHHVHSDKNWVQNVCKKNPSIVGEEDILKENFRFDSDIGNDDGFHFNPIILIVIVAVIVICWCIKRWI